MHDDGTNLIWTSEEIGGMARSTSRDGYVLVYPPGGGKYATASWEFEHRLIVEFHLGRKLKPTEVVHHKNGDKTDNQVENLLVMDASSHGREHAPLLGMFVLCRACGKLFYLSLAEKRKGRQTCSRRCGRKMPGAVANRKHLKPRVADASLNARIVEMRSAGLTWQEISEVTGVPYGGCRDRYNRTKGATNVPGN